jgi:4-carboxymuconolactone decarboxylase
MQRIIATLVPIVALSVLCSTPTWAQSTSAIVITRAAARPSTPAPTANFTGVARVQPLFDTTATTRSYSSSVSFEPGARTAWHTHPRGQVLIVTAGTGRVQRWGAPVEEIHSGDVVWIPSGVKHWHGAAPTAAMTHIAIVEHLDGKGVDWLEKVSDQQYAASPPGRTAVAGPQPSRAQQLMGDIAPKLAELTDSVLFGDVWARPQLSRRDRSLVTVSALIAMNRPDQLRSHIALARENGVTREELVEAITHLAFYAGWPNAVGAAMVAREVLGASPRP